MKSKKNKKGFTLIELIAVIVILGVLMLIAIPAVSRYIDNSKKEAYIKVMNSLTDTVRYAINSGDNKYIIDSDEKKVYLKEIELEKGSNNKSPYGDFIRVYSYIKISKNSDNDLYKYEVQAKDKSGHCIILTDVKNLTSESIKSGSVCENLLPYYPSYEIEDIITYKGSTWRVIKESSKEENYVTLLKEKLLKKAELGEAAAESGFDTLMFGRANSGLEYYMESKKMTNDLVEDAYGYKIRLITKEELMDNLGFKEYPPGIYATTAVIRKGPTTPSWVYFNKNDGNVTQYWTMTNDPDDNEYVLIVKAGGILESKWINNYSGVRPVINLLKTSIEN